jgi:hypothetical protein
MQTPSFAAIKNAVDTHNRPNSRKRKIRLAAIISTVLASSVTPSFCAEDSNQLGIEKIAEMTALVRHSEACPPVPREWSMGYLMLLMIAPPAEEQVVALEHKMLALRRDIGTVRWCQLYSVEMEEAYLIIKQATHR